MARECRRSFPDHLGRERFSVKSTKPLFQRANVSKSQIDPVINEIRKRMKSGHFGTTQENAWSFMALSKAIKKITSERPLRVEWKVG